MAVIKHIAIKNSNYDAATDYLTTKHDEFTSKPILDENGNRIPRDEYLIDGILCNPFTFGRECEAVNHQYRKNLTRAEIKAHHYIISFDPRDRAENGLTTEQAQQIGMDFARKNFPGHQTVVCTHPDGHNSAGNIHVHIVINSLRIKDVERQDFMELPSDSLAGMKHHVSKSYLEYLKQETMNICQQNGLYQVDLLNPAKVRITDREYWAQRRGQAALNAENAKIISEGFKPEATRYETEKGFLRRAITSVMQNCHSLDEFRQKLLSEYSITVQEKRGRLSYHLPERTRPIRARQLGTNFEKEFLESFFEKNVPIVSQAIKSKEEKPQTTAPQKSTNRGQYHGSSVRLIVDLQSCIKAQENHYYAQKVKVTNLQQMAKTLSFLQDNSIGTEEELSALLASTKADNEANRLKLKATEERLKTVNLLIKNSGQYLGNKKVYGAYLKAKDKKQFREEHLTEIMLYEAARSALKELSGGKTIPSLKLLKAEKEQLVSAKNEQYETYSFSRAKLRELQTVDANVRSILGTPELHQKQEQTRS